MAVRGSRQILPGRARRLTLGVATSLLLLVLGSGSAAWLVQQQQAERTSRQRQTDNQVQQALANARGLLEQGWQDNDPARLGERQPIPSPHRSACAAWEDKEFRRARTPGPGRSAAQPARAACQPACQRFGGVGRLPLQSEHPGKTRRMRWYRGGSLPTGQGVSGNACPRAAQRAPARNATTSWAGEIPWPGSPRGVPSGWSCGARPPRKGSYLLPLALAEALAWSDKATRPEQPAARSATSWPCASRPSYGNVRRGVVGPQLDGLAAGGLRLAILLLVIQGDAEVVEGLGQVGPQREGLAVGGHRLAVPRRRPTAPRSGCSRAAAGPDRPGAGA
jgi:hypothetical protein